MEQNIKKKLNEKRKKKHNNTSIKIASYSVLILIIIVFIGAPIITIFTGQQRATDYGSYAGQTIYYDSNNYFGRNAQAQIDFLKQRFGNQGLNDSLVQLAIKNAYDQTVEMYALMDIAKKNNYYVSDKKINTIIREFPDLQTDGKFDIELYKSIPADTRKKIIEVQKQFELSSTIRDDIKFAEIVSKQEQSFLNKLNNNKREIQFIVLDQSNVKNKDILKEYAKENQELFAQYNIKSLTVSDEQEALTIKQRIENNESTFAEEVASYSIDKGKEEEGERGNLYAYQISEDESEEALQAIQNLIDNTSISDIIRTNSGDFAFYIRNNNEEQKFDETDTEQLTTVQNYLNTYDPTYLENKIEEEAKGIISQIETSSFTEVAKNSDYPIQESSAFPLNIDDVALYDSIQDPTEDQESLQFLNKKDTILQDLFALNKGDTSTYYNIDNKTYIFHINDSISNNTDTVPEEKDINRIASFMKNYKTEQVKDFVIDDKKWVDNFDKVVNNN